MGLLTASVRMMYLNASRLDMEYKIQLVTKAKMDLSQSETELIDAGTDLDPNSVVVKQLEQRREKLHLLEKKLDNQLLQYQNKLKMIEQELASCKQMFDNNVKSSASYQ